jgi:hypothetical protein
LAAMLIGEAMLAFAAKDMGDNLCDILFCQIAFL